MQYFQEEQSDSDYEYDDDHKPSGARGVQRHLFDEEEEDINGNGNNYGEQEELKHNNGGGGDTQHKKSSMPLLPQREVVSDTEEDASNT